MANGESRMANCEKEQKNGLGMLNDESRMTDRGEEKNHLVSGRHS